MIRPRRRYRVDSFKAPDGEWRQLKNPDGPATGNQLRKLNELGVLELIAPANAEPITKGEASAVISEMTP